MAAGIGVGGEIAGGIRMGVVPLAARFVRADGATLQEATSMKLVLPISWMRRWPSFQGAQR
jgi:hypothetical protein